MFLIFFGILIACGFQEIIINFQAGKLLQHFAVRNISRCFSMIPKFNYSIYFLKGNDARHLNISQHQQILNIVENSNLNTSVLLYNSNYAKQKFRTWNQTLPWIKVHYAIKSNPAQQLLEDLIQQGSNFDCASKAEIESLLKLGVKPDQIVYSNSIKNQEDLEWAYNQGIKLTTADSIDQLIKLQTIAPQMRILWRISIKEEESDHLATPFSGKFGDDLQSNEKIEERMKQIQGMGINLKGIHFHCGSGQHGSSAFGRAVTFARECIKIGRNYNHEMSILDIGGGFPSGEISEKTVNALKITQNDPLNYKVMAEPGRHLCANSFYLLTRVLGKRVKNGKPCYHLNESLYHSFNCNLMDGVSFENSTSQFYACIDSKTKEPSGIYETQNSTLFGMTCDGMDIITKSINVPIDLKVSDWLCLSGMGAYTYGCKSTFNGMKATDKVIQWPTYIREEVQNGVPILSSEIV